MELWDLYDENGCLTGETMRRGEKTPPNRYHRVVEVLFLNSRGEILLQKRALQKKLYPDILWYPTGGAVLAGETVEQACRREVEEELGFSPDMEHARLLSHEVQHGFMRDLFLIRQDMPVENMRFQEGEVDGALWLLPENIPCEKGEWEAFSFLNHLKEALPFLLLESMRIRIPCGMYRHYKGKRYCVQGLCLHSETVEPMVIYQAQYGTRETWVRPAGMWNEEIMVNGQRVRRFQKTDD